MKPDLLICWIKHCDYPSFRRTLKKYRSFFGKIIVYFNENNRFPYLDHFLQTVLSDLGDIVFLDQAQIDWGRQDWRDIATNEMLKYSDSNWVASIEQDWVSQDWEKFFESCEETSKNAELFGWLNKTNVPYYHPSCFFIKRDLLEKTSKDFAAHPEIAGSDHFFKITQDAKELGAKVLPMTLDFDVIPTSNSFHLGGINQNYLSVFDGNIPEELHRQEIFYVYNYFSMKANVSQAPVFMELMQKVDNLLKSKYASPEESEWKKFFV